MDISFNEGLLLIVVIAVIFIVKGWERPSGSHEFSVGDKVIYVNVFGTVFLWEIGQQVFYEKYDGVVVPAYHRVNTDTPWYPTEEKDLFLAAKEDQYLTWQQLQDKYGFTPTETYGCW